MLFTGTLPVLPDPDDVFPTPWNIYAHSHLCQPLLSSTIVHISLGATSKNVHMCETIAPFRAGTRSYGPCHTGRMSQCPLILNVDFTIVIVPLRKGRLVTINSHTFPRSQRWFIWNQWLASLAYLSAGRESKLDKRKCYVNVTYHI